MFKPAFALKKSHFKQWDKAIRCIWYFANSATLQFRFTHNIVTYYHSSCSREIFMEIFWFFLPKQAHFSVFIHFQTNSHYIIWDFLYLSVCLPISASEMKLDCYNQKRNVRVTSCQTTYELDSSEIRKF